MEQYVSTAILFKSESDEFEDPYISSLKEINIFGKVIPVLKFEFINLDLLKVKLSTPKIYSGIVFSSPRCVKAIEKCGVNLLEWKNHNLFCVGKKTASLVEALFGVKPIGEDCGNASSLALYILKNHFTKSSPLLLPHGNLSLETLSTSLKENDFLVDPIEVYKSIVNLELSNLIKTYVDDKRTVDYILYFSPSGVDATLDLLKEILPTLNEVKFTAIGTTTEAHMKDKKLNVFCTAEKPTPYHLAQAITNKIKTESNVREYSHNK